MKRLLIVASGVLVVLSSPVHAGQQWQCGDGLTVPLTGSRAERDAACREAKERRDNPADGAISQEQADRLRQKIDQIEKDQGVEIKVDKLDKMSPPHAQQHQQ
jgi:hypothetical protein